MVTSYPHILAKPPKRWTMKDGQRLLVKGGSSYVKQEVYNEVVATKLHERLLSPQEFIPYALYKENGQTYCACPNMLGPDEEYIPAAQIVRRLKKSNNQSKLGFLTEAFEMLGIGSAEECLTKMFTCDFIIGNFDRHYNNFGVIRNVETLEIARFAPIFDSGSSLWCNKDSITKPSDYIYNARPFGDTRIDGRIGYPGERLLNKLTAFDWFDKSKLNGFVDDATSILGLNANMTKDRIELIRLGLEMQVKKTIEHVEETRAKSRSPFRDVDKNRLVAPAMAHKTTAILGSESRMATTNIHELSQNYQDRNTPTD